MAKAVNFIVNWKLAGVTDEPLEAGDTIALDPEDKKTQEFLRLGVLTREDGATAANLDKLTKAEIIALAKDSFKVDLDGSLAKADLVAQFKEFEEAANLEQNEQQS